MFTLKRTAQTCLPIATVLLLLVAVAQAQATPTPTPLATPMALPTDALTDAMLEAQMSGQYVGDIINPPIQSQDFVAPSTFDEAGHLTDLDGYWRVIFFGYMHCPDFCPLTLVEYRNVKKQLGADADAVRFVFVSVDAVRDTREALTDYLENFDPDFVGFSADDATLARIQPDYGFYYARRMSSTSRSVYTIDHSTRSYLVDPNGVLRATFAYDAHPTVIAEAIAWYLAKAVGD